MFNIRSNLFTVGLTLIAISCGKSDSQSTYPEVETDELVRETYETQVDNSPKSLTVIKTKKTKLLEDYTNLEQFKEDINTYRLKFRSKFGSLNNTEIICEKMNLSERKRYVVKATIHQARVAEMLLELSDKDPNETNFLCEVKNNSYEIERIKIKLLKSYIISKDENWNTYLPTDKIETLLIEKNATLFSYEMSQVLQTNTFISIGGLIKTFPESLTDSTMPNNNGKSGGSLVISTTEARGDLTVELRGLNAGVQTIVPEKNPAITEKNMNKNNCVSDGYGPPQNESNCYGQKGFPGKRGLKGFTGLKGGDTGAVFFKVSGKNNIKLQISYHAGMGGAGGVGGEGANGGEGGSGSYVTWRREPSRNDGGWRKANASLKSTASPNGERRYPDGARGEQGPRGEVGEDGENGRNLESEIDMDGLQMRINDFFTSGESK